MVKKIMVQITHGGDNCIKLNSILNAAQKRFGHYGLEKTTMREIANDVGISKAALYYYFPDKETIFKKVVEQEQESFFALVEENYRQTSDAVLMLKNFVDIRLKYFKTFFNLSRLRMEEFRNVKPILEDTLLQFRNKEKESLISILQKGVDQKVFNAENNICETASLFLDTLRGIRSLVFHNKEFMYIEQDDYDYLQKKMNELTEIFIRSLKYTG